MNAMQRMFHNHTWEHSEYNHPLQTIRERYPFVRYCTCGHAEVLHGAWSGYKPSCRDFTTDPKTGQKQPKYYLIQTPETWIALEKGAPTYATPDSNVDAGQAVAPVTKIETVPLPEET